MNSQQVGAALSKVAAAPWVCGTVAAEERAHTTKVRDWNRFWLETYFALGGKSRASGAKSCPRAAAYGLWLLGRLRCGTREFEAPSVVDIETRLGKNAAYAIIAIDLLAGGMTTSAPALWDAVRERFILATGHEPATSEQGEIRLVAILFEGNEIVVRHTTPV